MHLGNNTARVGVIWRRLRHSEHRGCGSCLGSLELFFRNCFIVPEASNGTAVCALVESVGATLSRAASMVSSNTWTQRCSTAPIVWPRLRLARQVGVMAFTGSFRASACGEMPAAVPLASRIYLKAECCKGENRIAPSDVLTRRYISQTQQNLRSPHTEVNLLTLLRAGEGLTPAGNGCNNSCRLWPTVKEHRSIHYM